MIDDGRGGFRTQQLAAEGDDPARVDLAHRQTGKTRRGVCFPQEAIDRKRRSRELGHRALDPPLLEERAERLGAGLLLTQRLRAPAPRGSQPRRVVQRVLEAVEAAAPGRAIDVGDTDAEDFGDRRIRSPQARLAVRSPRATARRTDRASTRMRSATSTAVRTAAGSRSSNGVWGWCGIGSSTLMSRTLRESGPLRIRPAAS